MRLSPSLFPYTLVVLDFLAALVYLTNGDIKRTVYWLAAMTLTITVTMK
jgi:hypothetical protein